ncbi:hypothetical protein OSG_eHP2_00170 [environmental Halophage eHP-2]|nr:hypothetical protein OSG_eHP2_00170 [environmental Halophage eHP-2]
MSHKRPDPKTNPTPWYVHRQLCQDYRQIANNGGDFEMLKALKIIRSILVNLGIIAVAIYSLQAGADPTTLGGLTVATLGLYNGVELADYAALAQAFSQAKGQTEQAQRQETQTKLNDSN